MNKKVFVNSRDEYLILRLQVLCERQGLSLCESADEDGVTLVVYDMDLPLAEQAYDGVRCLTVSRAEQTPADIHLPVLNAELTQLLREDRQGARLRIRAQEKSAYLDGRRIRLTEIEASLLSLLAEAKGECVSHEEAIARIWSGSASAGAVNVYVHYLREKLEITGERVILAKRGRGYAIDKKFLGGEDEC